MQPEFEEYTATLVAESKALKQKQSISKTQLFPTLKKELESKVLQEVYKRLFQVLNSRDGDVLTSIEESILLALNETFEDPKS